MDFELLKKHPYMTGGITLAGALVLYFLLASKQTGNTSTTSSGGGASAYAADVALQQTQAASQAQVNQLQAQAQIASINAGVARQQVAVQQNSNDANLAATLYSIEAGTTQNRDTINAQTTQQANQLTYAQNIQSMQDAVLTSQINSSVTEQLDTNATQLAGLNANLNYQAGVAKLQAGIATATLSDQTLIAQQELAHQYALKTQSLSYINSVNGSQNRVGIIDAVLGQGGAAQANAIGAATDTNLGLYNLVGSLAKTVTGAVFGA